MTMNAQAPVAKTVRLHHRWSIGAAFDLVTGSLVRGKIGVLMPGHDAGHDVL
jgi:hypothetical protein